MPETDSDRSANHRSKRFSLPTQIISVILLELTVTGIAFLLWKNGWAFGAMRAQALWAISMIVTFAMVQGLVLSEFPRGDDNTFLRLGLATFCRTGLPLIGVIAIAKYSAGDKREQAIFLVAVLYAVGHFGSMILTGLRYR